MMWEKSTEAGGRFGASCEPGVPPATSSASPRVGGTLQCFLGCLVVSWERVGFILRMDFIQTKQLQAHRI